MVIFFSFMVAPTPYEREMVSLEPSLSESKYWLFIECVPDLIYIGPLLKPCFWP